MQVGVTFVVRSGQDVVRVNYKVKSGTTEVGKPGLPLVRPQRTSEAIEREQGDSRSEDRWVPRFQERRVEKRKL